MPKVLIIERDRDVVSSLERLLDALNIEAEVVRSHPTALQSYSSDELKAVFIGAEMAAISVNRLLAEFEDISAGEGRARPPVIFLYQREESIRQQRLADVSDSVCLKKPVLLAELYRILEELKLTHIDSDPAAMVGEKISKFDGFLQTSKDWLERLKNELSKL